MSHLNWEIYQREQVSRVTDMELVLLIAHLIRSLGSMPGWNELGTVKQTNNQNLRMI